MTVFRFFTYTGGGVLFSTLRKKGNSLPSFEGWAILKELHNIWVLLSQNRGSKTSDLPFGFLLKYPPKKGFFPHETEPFRRRRPPKFLQTPDCSPMRRGHLTDRDPMGFRRRPVRLRHAVAMGDVRRGP